MLVGHYIRQTIGVNTAETSPKVDATHCLKISVQSFSQMQSLSLAQSNSCRFCAIFMGARSVFLSLLTKEMAE
jgi:hypothetical protein